MAPKKSEGRFLRKASWAPDLQPCPLRPAFGDGAPFKIATPKKGALPSLPLLDLEVFGKTISANPRKASLRRESDLNQRAEQNDWQAIVILGRTRRLAHQHVPQKPGGPTRPLAHPVLRSYPPGEASSFVQCSNDLQPASFQVDLNTQREHPVNNFWPYENQSSLA